MTAAELTKAKRKYHRSLTLAIFVGICFSFFCYAIHQNLDSTLMYIFFVAFIICTIMIYIGIFKLLFSENSIKQDFLHKNKICVSLHIEKMQCASGIDNDYRLFFEPNDYLHSYIVGVKTYHSLKEGDIIDIEITEFGKWILSIKHNDTSIEYKGYIK
ncbi:MAG: hypothetical protein ACFNZU_02390 [Capnocytophaga granulosa]